MDWYSEFELYISISIFPIGKAQEGLQWVGWDSCVILQKKNYLFVDGRYTIQAKQQSGNQFEIIEIHKLLPKKILKNLNLGFDPSLFTKKSKTLIKNGPKKS